MKKNIHIQIAYKNEGGKSLNDVHNLLHVELRGKSSMVIGWTQLVTCAPNGRYPITNP